MDPLFLLQYSCFLFTTMCALMLVIARIHLPRVYRNYERMRWEVCAAMAILAIHYFLQMRFGLRASGDDVGLVVNILFYTPAIILMCFALSHSGHSPRYYRRFRISAIVACSLVATIFLTGWLSHKSLHMGRYGTVLHIVYFITISGFITSTILNIRKTFRGIIGLIGGDLKPLVRHFWTGYFVLCTTGFVGSASIFSTSLLLFIGPLCMLSIFFFIMNIIALGNFLMPIEELMEEDEESTETPMPADGLTKGDEPRNAPCAPQLSDIESALQQWTGQEKYRDATATIASLSHDTGIAKQHLTAYFEEKGLGNFRMWLGDIRFEKAKCLLTKHPEYSNDAISAACGFSSRSHLYRIFRNRTGMSPGEWQAAQGEDSATSHEGSAEG